MGRIHVESDKRISLYCWENNYNAMSHEHEPIESDVFDHSEADAERMQERSDERREEMAETIAKDTVNAIKHHQAIMEVINNAIK